MWAKWQIKAITASFPLPVSFARSHLLHKNCYSDVALNNFRDQGCGSRKPLLASLTLLSFLPISEHAINIYEDIWIMWIELTKHNFENRQVERAGRWGIGKQQRWKELPNMKCESSQGGDVDPARRCKYIMTVFYLWSLQNHIIHVTLWTYQLLTVIRLISHSPYVCSVSYCSLKDVTAIT